MPSAVADPIRVEAEVLSVRRVGEYFVMAFAAPGIAERVSPGHFVAIAVGGDRSSMLLRRSFSIYRVDPSGSFGGTLEIVVGPKGAGTQWLVSRRPGDMVNLIAPLGRPFSLPVDPVACILVGGGYGAAPMFALAEQLRERGSHVDLVLGAATESRLFGLVEGRRAATTLTTTTEDGSDGVKGRVTDVLPDLIKQHDSQVIYGCGPMGMLQAIAGVASDHGIASQCAVEESMACGVGVCMTCVLPVIGNDGVTRMVRSCTEGPVFFGDQVRWSDVGTVPDDCLGAPTPTVVSAPLQGRGALPDEPAPRGPVSRGGVR